MTIKKQHILVALLISCAASMQASDSCVGESDGEGYNMPYQEPRGQSAYGSDSKSSTAGAASSWFTLTKDEFTDLCKKTQDQIKHDAFFENVVVKTFLMTTCCAAKRFGGWGLLVPTATMAYQSMPAGGRGKNLSSAVSTAAATLTTAVICKVGNRLFGKNNKKKVHLTEELES